MRSTPGFGMPSLYGFGKMGWLRGFDPSWSNQEVRVPTPAVGRLPPHQDAGRGPAEFRRGPGLLLLALRPFLGVLLLGDVAAAFLQSRGTLGVHWRVVGPLGRHVGLGED